MRRLVLRACASLVLFAIACGPSDVVPCFSGTESCPCYPNGTCNTQLSCVAEHCVGAGGKSSGSNTAAHDAGARGTKTLPGTSAAGNGGLAATGGGSGGSAASGGTPATPDAGTGEDSGAASGGACAAPGGDCTTEMCCNAAPCIESVCAAPCSQNNECISSCCFKLNSGSSICAPANVCPAPVDPNCVGAGADCSVHSCCGGVLCVEKVCASTCSKKTDCAIQVELLDVVVESQIISNFNGWSGDTMFQLANGQVWQQSAFGSDSDVETRPDAVIFRKDGHFEMAVDGVDSSVQVTQLQ